MFDLQQLEHAQGVVGAAMPPTPAYAWPLLSERLGATAIVKHENHTPIGAFKVRGGLVYVDRLKRERPRTAGLISATRGNHGQSLAFAAGRYCVPVTIYVPHGNSIEKNRAMRAFGAKLVEHGEDFQSAREEAERHASRDGLEFVPSFHPDLVMGVATYALEFLRKVADLDVLYVPIGQGSGICGCILVRDLLGLTTEIVGVQSTEAPSYALSFAAGTVVTTETSNTLADGLATRVPDPDALAIIRKGASRIVRVTDAEVAAAIRAYWTDTHNLAEGAGAAALAAALQERPKISGKRVGLILSGGNIDFDLFNRWVMDTSSQASSSGSAGRSSTPRPAHSPQAPAITGCPPAQA
jgi:threonine dehydratase